MAACVIKALEAYKMLQDQVVLEYLQHGGSVPEHNIFTSVAVIHSFATKCRAREARRFVVGALLDGVRTGNMETNAITTRGNGGAMAGREQPVGGA